MLQSNLKQSKNQFDPKTGEMVNNVNPKDSVLIKKEPFIQLNPETAETLSKITSGLKRIFCQHHGFLITQILRLRERLN